MTQSDRSRAATFQLLAGLTIDEKIALLSGASSWQTVGYPDRGIRSMTAQRRPPRSRRGRSG